MTKPDLLSCWEWQGARERTGYGRLKVAGRAVFAHRLAYEIHKGAIPAGHVVDHLCRNRACCNPTHLEAVTPRENTMRGNSPTAIAARTDTCKRGHSLADAPVRASGARDCRACNAIRKAAKRAAAKQAAGGAK